MKYYILLIYLLAFSLATEGNTAVKDSLSEALPSASSPLQKLEIMTNLMDLSRQEEQVEYAKQLYWLALEEDEDYYKEAALTEILRFYVNTDAKDSAKVYLAEAERELKGKARDFLVTYMKTIMDVRVVYYTKGEDRMKLIEKYKLRLETEKDMPVLDKISNYYLLGMANINLVDPKNQDAIYKEVCYYMNNLIELSEMGMEDKTVGISPVGCAVFAYNYLDIDWQEAAHGRAPAVATAVKRLWPDRLVFTYQGDGDLACIGTAETIHALNRGENITIIFINNAIYGMTGGQMAPTTLVGMKSSTCPYGRDVELHGYPLKITEIAAQLEGTAYVSRQSVQSVPAIRKAKKAIRKAFENSMNGKGSNLVEIVSTCSSGWKMTPEKANKWMEEHMFPFYPLGDLKDKE